MELVLEGDAIRALPREGDGFDVWLYPAHNQWIVGYDGWHEHFASVEQAMACFLDAFSGELRLRVSLRGRHAHSWTLEARNGETWRPVSTTGRLFFAFWRRRRIEYRQNRPVSIPPTS